MSPTPFAKFKAIAQDRTVTVTLEGTIFLDQVRILQTFLDSVLTFPGNRWILQVQNLTLISHRGLVVLFNFAKEIRDRGYEVEITRLHPLVLDAFEAAQVLGCFSTKGLEIH